MILIKTKTMTNQDYVTIIIYNYNKIKLFEKKYKNKQNIISNFRQKTALTKV